MLSWITEEKALFENNRDLFQEIDHYVRAAS